MHCMGLFFTYFQSNSPVRFWNINEKIIKGNLRGTIKFKLKIRVTTYWKTKKQKWRQKIEEKKYEKNEKLQKGFEPKSPSERRAR